MSDFENHVIIPSDDFQKLQTKAYQQTQYSTGDRIAVVVQNTTFFAAIAGAVTLGTWGCVKAMDWRDKRRHERMMTEFEHRNK